MTDADIRELADELTAVCIRLRAAELVDASLTDLQIERSIIEDGSFRGAELDRANLVDMRITRADFANTDWRRSNLHRVAASGLRLTGAQLYEARLRDVVFEDCSLDLATFGAARLERVRFEGCRMAEASLKQAELRDVSFDSCILAASDFNGAVCERVSFRDCDMTNLRGLRSLAGSSMAWDDLLGIAPLLAAALEIGISDLPGDDREDRTAGLPAS